MSRASPSPARRKNGHSSPTPGKKQLGVVAVFMLLAISAIVSAWRLPIETYTSAEGLAHDRVKRIVLDSNGFLWFCTNGGLSRFDGERFTSFSTEHGLGHLSANDLIESRSGTYWVATNGGGIARLDPETSSSRWGDSEDRSSRDFEAFSLSEEAAADRVNVIREDRSGRLWAGTDGGLFVLEAVGSSLSSRRVELELSGTSDAVIQVWAIEESKTGDLWIGTSEGLFRRPPKGPTSSYALRTQQGADHVWALREDAAGRLWIGHDSGLFVLQPGKTSRPARYSLGSQSSQCSMAGDGKKIDLSLESGQICYLSTSHGLAGGGVLGLHTTSDGHLWIASEKGLTEFDGDRFHAFTSFHGLPDRTLSAVASDRAGNIWIASDDGAARWSRGGFVTFTKADGLEGTWIGSIFEDHSGNLIVVTSGRHLHRFDGERFVAVEPNLPDRLGFRGRGRYPIALLDHLGEWWIPTGDGLYRFPKVERLEDLAEVQPRNVYSTRDGLAGDDIWQMFEDSRGDLWFATRIPESEVLTRWDRMTEVFQTYSDVDGLDPLVAANEIREDLSGAIWIRFWSGKVARYRNGSFRLFTPDDGLPAYEVSSLHVDPLGHLWIGSDQGHLARLKDPFEKTPVWQSYLGDRSADRGGASSLGEDRWGHLYLGTGLGVDRFEPTSRQIRRFSRAHGLVGVSPQVIYGDRKGSMWFGTTNGLSRLEPADDLPPPISPVRIDGLRIDGIPLPISRLGLNRLGSLKLRPDQHHLGIEFAGISFTPGEILRFQYRLEGASSDWSPPSTDRSVQFANLGPAQYRFMVRAVTSDGSVSPVPAEISFTMLAPFWQRVWFQGTIAILVIFGLTALHRFRLRRALEMERLRARIASDLHDDLGSSLTRVSVLSELARRRVTDKDEEAANIMAQVGETARTLTDTTRDLVWSIDPRSGDLKSLVTRLRRFASDLLDAEGIAFDLEVSDNQDRINLTSVQRHHLLLFMKEALHNVVRHAEASRVRMSITVRGAILRAEVEDDGSGFIPGQDSEAAGQGLRGMRNRANELSGRLSLDSQPGQGTRLNLEAPLR